jgi:hypothetical protein
MFHISRTLIHSYERLTKGETLRQFIELFHALPLEIASILDTELFLQTSQSRWHDGSAITHRKQNVSNNSAHVILDVPCLGVSFLDRGYSIREPFLNRVEHLPHGIVVTAPTVGGEWLRTLSEAQQVLHTFFFAKKGFNNFM